MGHMEAEANVRAAVVGCGYVGKAVARSWQQQGLSVTATTTTPGRIEELQAVADRVMVVQGCDPEALQSCLAERQVALLSVGAKRGVNYADTYLGTAKTVAEILPNTSVQQLIYTSTSSVYGQQQGATVTEATAVNPVTDNGKVIAEAEQLLLGLPQAVCVLRLGGIYGPGRTLAKIYGRAAGQTRPGKGEQATNWVHLSDIVGAIDFAREHRLSGIYNVVQDEVPTVRELIAEVCDRNGLEPVKWDPTQPSSRAYNARVSNAKLKAAGYGFVHPRFFMD